MQTNFFIGVFYHNRPLLEGTAHCPTVASSRRGHKEVVLDRWIRVERRGCRAETSADVVMLVKKILDLKSQFPSFPTINRLKGKYRVRGQAPAIAVIGEVIGQDLLGDRKHAELNIQVFQRLCQKTGSEAVSRDHRDMVAAYFSGRRVGLEKRLDGSVAGPRFKPRQNLAFHKCFRAVALGLSKIITTPE